MIEYDEGNVNRELFAINKVFIPNANDNESSFAPNEMIVGSVKFIFIIIYVEVILVTLHAII